nr:hypothetical protein [Sneathiella sp.]
MRFRFLRINADLVCQRKDHRIHAPKAPVQAEKAAALSADDLQQLCEILFIYLFADQAQRLPQRDILRALAGKQSIIAGNLHDFIGRPLIHHFKIGRKPGFQRKPAKDGFTEGMDGLDFEPARRVQDARKQTARPHPLPVFWHAAQKIDKTFIQGLLIHNRPAAEYAVQPVRHLRRRGLGKSDAENFFRRRPGEHQTKAAFH